MVDWANYQNKTLDDNVNELLLSFLEDNKVKNAIDLGCGSGNETVFLAKKGINVLAIDYKLNKSFILERLSENEIKNVSFNESRFEKVQLPKTDLIVALFSIPFCDPKYFNELWDKIYNSLNTNGYFVGQLFGDRDAWNDSERINTFTKEQSLTLLKKYKIIKFDEIEYVRKSDNKKWHYFNIIAQKREVTNDENGDI